MFVRTFGGDTDGFFFVTKKGVFVTGINSCGQLGIGDKTPRMNLEEIRYLRNKRIVSVDCCWHSTSFLTENGKLFTCGLNIKGQLGVGDTENRVTPTLVTFPGKKTRIQAIRGGDNFMMVLTTEGKLFSWGSSENGQLGIGRSETPMLTPTLVSTISSQKIISLACGYGHTLVLTEKNELFSWGVNFNGQLGIGNIKDTSTPTIVSLFSSRDKIIQIACGDDHSLALTEGGNNVTHVFSWGCGDDGQLGHGDKNDQMKPKLIESLKQEKVTLIDCGDFFSVVMTRNGEVFAWGGNRCNQISLKDKKKRLLPMKMEIPTKERIVHVVCASHNIGLVTENAHFLMFGSFVQEKLERRMYETDYFQLKNGVFGGTYCQSRFKIIKPVDLIVEKKVEKCARFVLFLLCPEHKAILGKNGWLTKTTGEYIGL